MRTCIYCKTRYEKGSGVTFHKFPSDHTLKLWLENMNIVNWIPKSHDYLCSKHFTDDSFIKHLSRTTLKKYSIPTIFLETDSSLVTAQSEMSLSMQVELPNFDLTHHTSTAETDSSLVTAQSEMSSSMQVELPNFDLTHHTSTAVPSTSYNTSQCRTPKRTYAEIWASIKLDHRYESTPKSPKNEELQRVKKALKMSQARVKVLSQNVKRLKLRVSSLRIVIADLKKRKEKVGKVAAEKAFNKITQKDWDNSCKRVKNIENNYYERELSLYENNEELVIDLRDNSSTTSYSNMEDESAPCFIELETSDDSDGCSI